ncbi:unnamed protein product [Parajaminaea phylloscopi]
MCRLVVTVCVLDGLHLAGDQPAPRGLRANFVLEPRRNLLPHRLLILHIPTLVKMTRLYSKGRVLGHQRGKHVSHPRTSLLKIENVDSSADAQFYCGKRVAYVYKAPTDRKGSNVRVIWGRVTRPHGNSGVVRSKFRSNLPPKAFGASVRVMLYPSNI